MNLNLSFNPGELYFGIVHDKKSLSKCLPTLSPTFSSLNSNYRSRKLTALNPLTPTFPPQESPKPYSKGRPVTHLRMELGDSTETPTNSTESSLPLVACYYQVVKQLHSLKAQMSHLNAFSESSFQKNTPLIKKFPPAHLKQVKYLHADQLAVAQFHQALELERLERYTLQFLVFQL